MKDRIKMNTESLQKEFPQVYEEFFVNHDLVVSGCFSIPWGPSWLWHKSKYFRMKSKIPLKCYVGINKTKNIWIHFNNIYFFDIINKSYENNKFIDINKKAEIIINYIEKELELKENSIGFEISILSEIPRWHWLGLTWTFASILGMGLFLSLSKINIDNFINYDDFLLSNEMKEVFSFARWLDYISKFGNSNGDNSMNTLYNYSNPTLFLCENFEFDIWLDNLKNKKYAFYDIYDMFGEQAVCDELPIDYCLIYSGLLSDTHKIEQFLKADINKLNIYSEFYKEEIIKKNKALELYSNKFEKKDSIYQNFINNIVIIYMEVLFLFKKMLITGYDNLIMDEFINAINNYKHSIYLIESPSDFIEKFEYFFKKFTLNVDEKVGIIPIYSWKIWGWYLVVMKHSKSRDTINKVLKDISYYYPNVKIEYASWLDWTSSDGVKLNQYVSEGIYSKYFDKNKLILQTNKGIKILGEHWELIDKMWEGILVDTINRKIFVNGQKLTSKDIPSQSTTVDVLSILLENKWKEVSNNIFEVSSYSKNKNDMIGKIVIPLTKLTKKYFGKELALDCKWSLVEFKMILLEKDIEIWIINKIKI